MKIYMVLVHVSCFAYTVKSNQNKKIQGNYDLDYNTVKH